ncbi:MAG: carboxylesterase/lipase family protein [Actinomycetota bacterium]|nr:carboxylesterase/lipase family protein [Actinomycetota bacterium]
MSGNHAGIVRTRAGELCGTRQNQVWRFAGVPYAAPPVGPRRFRPPEPHPGWDGVRPALDFGPIAPQTTNPLETMLMGGEVPQSEDCLTLNVWTPGLDDAERPVMVWVHGGGNVMGSGRFPVYDGATFAARGDVVCVTFNYRLGELGYLHLDHLDDRFAGSANHAVLDQVLALEWVRDEIAAFGGDPDNVTVFGESAGAMSIGVLAGMDRADGLFRRAILQSGAAANVHERDVAIAVADRVLDDLALSSVDDVVEADLADLMRARTKAVDEARKLTGVLGALPFQPVVDGVVVDRHPLEALRAGAAAGLPMLVGTNADEWKMFDLSSPTPASEESVRADLARALGADRVDEALAAYREVHPDADHAGLRSAMMTDAVFRMPAVDLAEARIGTGEDVWSYLFTWQSPAMGGMLGSCHALELPFVFRTIGLPAASLLLGGEEPPWALSEAIQDAWIAFARTGDPSHPNLPAWPRHDLDERPTMELGSTCGVISDHAAATRRLWRS